MYQVGAVAVDDEAVRLVFEVLLEALMVLGVDALMPQPEPFQRDVGTEHAHLAPLVVADMRQVGGSQLLRGRTVEVGWCPVSLRTLEGSLVPGVCQVVGVVLVHLFAPDGARRVAPGVDLEVMALLWEEVRFEYQSAARHIHIQLHHALQMRLQLVGIVDVALDVVDIVDGAHVHVREHAAYPFVRVEDDAFVARPRFECHRVLRHVMHGDHNDGHHHDQHKHHSETQDICERMFLHGPYV